MIRRQWVVYGLVIGAWLSSGCESPPSPAKEEKASQVETQRTAALQPAPVQTVAATARAEKKPARPEIECAQGNTADFHDPQLEREVRRKLQKPEGKISKAELKTIRSINVARGGAVDFLDPCIFPHLTGVRDLFLGPGKLDDLSILAKLPRLESLRAAMNQVSDVTPLATLRKLDRLDLSNTLVRDISPIAKLTQLTELQLDGTQISDVSPLAKLENLERLSLQRTQVREIAVLRPLKKLKYLYVQNSPVDDPFTVARPGLRVVTE